MAKSTQKSIKLGQLIRSSEASRLQLGLAHARLKHRLDVSARIKESMKAEPVKWLGGSAVAGFFGSFLFKSKKKKISEQAKTVKKERNFLLGMFGLVITLVKPAAKIYATKLLKDYFKNQLSRGVSQRSVGGNRPLY